MEIQVYKIPDSVDIDFLRNAKGDNGNFLNPIQDADGNWIVSVEEWQAEEFQYLKKQYPEQIKAFTLISYNPKPPTDNF